MEAKYICLYKIQLCLMRLRPSKKLSYLVMFDDDSLESSFIVGVFNSWCSR